MAASGADLLDLQAHIKKDKDGYKDEFMLQWRHYKACLDIFNLKPSNESKQFSDLVMFIAHACKSYPKETDGFAQELIVLLETHHGVLDPSLRKQLVQALILLRNRGQMQPSQLLPLFFKLFKCQDKALREMLFRHIVADIKGSNRKGRNDKLNRSLQNFLYGVIQDDNETMAKKSLSVLTELWRSHVWRDARTVNVIASATFHKSPRIMLAVLKFFLGQDQRAAGDGSDSDEEQEEDNKGGGAAPSKEEIYKAYKKGTRSSKKKKQAKLKRAMATVKKQARKGGDSMQESFAAVHLLHDPQAFAERLFGRVQSGSERFETRLAALSVISRVVGVHKLLLLNFYPFVQKYCQPHQREVTQLLAALVQACHDLVPPETLQPVLRQLVDSFVHDKARPEVMTVGLKTVREICMRAPLVMSEELLQDLALYKKFREKEVSSSARALISLFRELNPALLAKRDRGRGADLEQQPAVYGGQDVKSRVDGADLLQAALAAGADPDGDSDLEGLLGEGGSSDDDDDGSSGWEDVESDEGEEGAAAGSSSEDDAAAAEDDPAEDGSDGSDDEAEDDSSSGSDVAEGDEDSEGWVDVESGEGEEASSSSSSEEEEEEEIDDEQLAQRLAGGSKAAKQQPAQQDSIAALKKQLAAKKAQQQQQQEEEGEGEQQQQQQQQPIEMERFLTEEDFARIRKLKHRKMVEAALAKHGLKSTAAKRRRLLESAQEEAEELLQQQQKRAKITEETVDAADLQGRHKRRKDKAERMAAVLAGREGREFGAAAKFKKHKTGGLSEREKQRKKAMPIAARLKQLAKRHDTNKRKSSFKKSGKNFKGHVRG